MVKPIVTIFAATVISSALAVALSRNDEVARDAAVQWLELIDAHRFEEAASQGSQEVRSFENWKNQFATQRGPLGRANKRHLVELKHTAVVPGVPEVRRYTIIRFKTSFERRAAAIEEIVLTKMGCCWEIFGYTINDR